MDARSPRNSSGTATPGQRRGADHIAPDCAGQNFYAIDRGLRDLLAHYLTPDDFARLEPHFDRLGALAGNRLDYIYMI
jgi:acyl-CoA dehydrogenase